MKHFYTDSLMNRPNTERCTLGNENQQNRYGETLAFSIRNIAATVIMLLAVCLSGTVWGQAKPENSKGAKATKATAVQAKADKKAAKAKAAMVEDVKRSATKSADSRRNQAKPAKQNPENLPEFKESWKNNTGIFSRYHANKWSAQGLYAGLTPQQEQIQYRTEHSKTFDNGDGTFSYMYIGDLHYKDANGSWQDIEVNFEKTNNGPYRYANTKNKFQTYYSDSPSEGIMMKYLGRNLVFAKDYRFEFLDAQGNAIKDRNRTTESAHQDDYRTLSYRNFYSDIDYNIIQLGRGVETGFSVKSRNAVADVAKTVRISQTVELPQGAYMVTDGKKQSKTFRASEFEVMIPGHDSWITFQPVVVYDAHVDMDYIMKRAEIRHEGDKYDKEGKPVEDPMAKHSYKAMYNVSQSGSTLTVSFDLPAEWMLASERTFPLFIDPTVTVLSGTASVTSPYTFYNTLYHDSRWDVQITDAEMIAAGINNGATISACGLLCSTAPGRTVEKARIDLNNTAWTNGSWVTTGWTNCYYAASLATPTVSTTTWNTYTFQTNFTYSNANSNLLVRLSKDGSAWSSGGGNYCVSSTTGATARGGYQDNSGGYPFNSISNSGDAVRPAMQLTYTNANSSCSHTEQTVGTHTSGIDDMSPLAPDYNYSYTQTIYTPDEVCGSGTGADLYGIAFYYYGRSTSGTGGDIVRNVTIYLSETTNDQLSNWETTGLTQVFSGNVAFIKGSWTWITFNTPFSYSGNNNLVVTVNDKSNHKDNSDDLCYFYVDNSPDDGIHRELIYYNDQTSVTNIGNPPGYNFYATFRPYTKFCVECAACDYVINMSNNLSQTIECGDNYCFYDDGGKEGNYSYNSSSVTTQTATFTSCGDIHIIFPSFATESTGSSDYDNIKIYDGDASTGTKLVFGCTGWTNGSNGAAAGFSNILATGTTYTCTSGTMTVVWKSDGSNVAAGWEATITADNCCTNPTLSGCPVGNMVSGGWADLGTSCGTITACTSSNTNVATVTSAGHIVAVAPGTATITATITKGPCTYNRTCTVSIPCPKIEVGDLSVTTTNYYLPSHSNYRYSLSQQIYTPCEIGVSGTLNSISFYNEGTAKTRTLDIYLVNTAKTTFANTSDWITVTAADRVFSGSVTMTAGDWTTINFSTPFVYNGTSNLAVIVDDNTGTYSSGMACRVYPADGNQAMYQYSDSQNNDPSNPSYTGTRTTVKNQLKFGCCDKVDLPGYTITATANPVAGGTTTVVNDNGCHYTVTATASECYIFENWTDGGEVVSTSPSYSFTANGDRTLVANFEAKSVNISSDPASLDCLESGTEVVLTASVEGGNYLFTTGTDASRWYNVTNTTNIITTSGDGVASALQDIGFQFPFSGTNYTQFSVNSDGNLRLGPTVTGTGSYGTPFSNTNANANNPKINGFGFDGYFDITNYNNYVHAQVFGAEPNRVLVVEFYESPYNTTYRQYPWKWQVQLSENGTVQIVYASTAPASYGVANQIGMCVDASDGYTVSTTTHEATHFTNGTSTQNAAANSWPGVNRWYRFTPASFAWSYTGTAGTASNNTYTVSPTQNSTYTATVTVGSCSYSGSIDININDYTIDATANPVAGGTVTKTQNSGCNYTVTASPTTCYKFVNWTEGGSVVSTDANYSFTASGDRNLVANFEEMSVSITSTPDPLTCLTSGTDVVLTASTDIPVENSLAGYTFSTGTDASRWYNVTNTTNIMDGGTTTGDFAYSSVKEIGFTFPFGGTDYTQFSVNADGNLRLGPTVTGTSYYSSPFSSTNANNNNPKINGFGFDGFFDISNYSNYVHMQVFGTAPNRVLVVEFNESPYNSTYRPYPWKWQVQLFENGIVQIVYYSTAPTSYGVANQVGLCVNASDGWTVSTTAHTATHFTNGTDANNAAASSWPGNNRWYRFTPPSPYVWTYTGTEGTADGETYRVSPTQNSTYTVSVTGGGCTKTASVDATLQLDATIEISNP